MISRLEPRHALSELLPRRARSAPARRHDPQAAARPFLRRGLQAEGPPRRHLRSVLRLDGSDGEEMGELLYTSMTVGGEMRKFYRFRTPDDAVDYYDEQGNSAKKFLMRNPVKGGRYTSGFGNRKHPLLRRIRMHTGVDWAAPSGTPILAAGDGTIEIAERHGGYGNYIRIRHANGFATAYGHMTRFAPGSEPGASVKQGQIIGFVGSTGRSTGPALSLRGPGQQQVRQPDDHRRAARPPARRPRARRLPERAPPHRGPDAARSRHQPRRPGRHPVSFASLASLSLSPDNLFSPVMPDLQNRRDCIAGDARRRDLFRASSKSEKFVRDVWRSATKPRPWIDARQCAVATDVSDVAETDVSTTISANGSIDRCCR